MLDELPTDIYRGRILNSQERLTMERPILCILIVIALTICRGSSKLESQNLVIGEPTPIVIGEPTPIGLTKTNNATLDSRQSTTDTDRADKLFDQEKWAEARSLYDQAKSSTVKVQQHIAERAITCSIKLLDWDGALRRALEFRDSNRLPVERLAFSL
jgi:hypothetical protein